MNQISDEYKQLNNEVVFRSANERIENNIQNLKELASNENELGLAPNEDLSLHFLCECSDENCQDRIVMTLKEYRFHHENRKCFTLAHDHQVIEVEKVILTSTDYIVVEKYKEPPRNASRLRKTNVDNT